MHAGHFKMLLFARQLAGPTGKVIVSLDSDEKIKKDKGEDRPIFSLGERFEMIKYLGIVDMIHKHGDNHELASNIWSASPDYILVGENYKGYKVVGDDRATVIYFKLLGGVSTTEIITRIRNAGKV